MNPIKAERALLLLCLFLSATGTIWLRTANVKATYRYVELEKNLSEIEKDTQILRIKRVKLTSPRRLEEIAKTQGLGPAGRGQIISLSPAGRE